MHRCDVLLVAGAAQMNIAAGEETNGVEMVTYPGIALARNILDPLYFTGAASDGLLT